MTRSLRGSQGVPLGGPRRARKAAACTHGHINPEDGVPAPLCAAHAHTRDVLGLSCRPVPTLCHLICLLFDSKHRSSDGGVLWPELLIHAPRGSSLSRRRGQPPGQDKDIVPPAPQEAACELPGGSTRQGPRCPPPPPGTPLPPASIPSGNHTDALLPEGLRTCKKPMRCKPILNPVQPSPL